MVLDHVKIYACGQVETDPDAGGWRRVLAMRLATVNPFMKFWDPLIKPTWMSKDALSDIPLDVGTMFAGDRLKQRKVWQANAEVRNVCKALAGQADIFIARLSKRFTWGSIDELEIAAERRIPVFFIFPDGPIGVYGMPGVISDPKFVPEYIHYTMDSLVDKFRAIDGGSCTLPQRDPLRWLSLTYPNASRVPNGNSTTKQSRTRR